MYGSFQTLCYRWEKLKYKTTYNNNKALKLKKKNVFVTFVVFLMVGVIPWKKSISGSGWGDSCLTRLRPWDSSKPHESQDWSSVWKIFKKKKKIKEISSDY